METLIYGSMDMIDMNLYDLEGGHLTYIISNRIRDYEDDIKYVEEHNKKHKSKEDLERVKQDKVVVQELEKILYGKDLEFLSYVS